MSARIVIPLLTAVLAVALAVDYAFHLDQPKPNRPAIVQLQRQVAHLQRSVAALQQRVDRLERGKSPAG
jgi:ubiquinone biosynthesis protein UbiJ